ncbi:hypothetical protein O6H91_11G116900 [Diphasiastrum complanatum]|nr:hypothetical protein O6H91_11G116900 [Diphasiastrum complanatum]KAJ7539955.1 hypothetical protein O6H91_11G116900 [Diphasiastrum complanatum]KAJ7539956.1 hypothetical protein O6H91_11G116900 [Diphasiastrum complanatum]KAJ7539957.1 hypothetical protein O6H91_11G116900 [Diphasiastrum complanatum]KAJ7539958.1 hypothetical protein O6H91_11G116900 [Diphasiastrum complanatum]
MAPVKLPPGFRFHPTDVELVTYYLKRKVNGRAIEYDLVAVVDLYKCEPWDLPDKSLIGSSDPEWYFFSARDKKYANGSRTNRATEAGYWKATGKDRAVRTGSHIVGMKKTLVFYKGRAPHGERTDWLMHEYRLEDNESGKLKLQDAFVLCRVFKKNGIGPNNSENMSASLDVENEVTATTTEDGPVSDERQLVSESQAVPFSAVSLTKEEEFRHLEMKDHKIVVDDNPAFGVPSNSFKPKEETENDLRMFYDILLNDLNQSLDAVSTVNESTSQLERLDTMLETEGSASPMTAQDFALWLKAPVSLGEHNATASVSANQVDLSDYYSAEEAEMLDELYRSTLQSQESKAAAQHVGESSLESKYLVQMSTIGKTIPKDMYELSEVDDYMFKDELSNLSEQKPFEEGQVFNLNPLSASEEVSEEDVLEEMFQIIKRSHKEGQQSQVERTQFQGEGATVGLKDAYFDVDDWMHGDSWNEASTIGLEFIDAVEPTNCHLENWLNETLASPSDLPSFTEGLLDLLNSDLSMQTLHTPIQGQGQIELQSGTKHDISFLADLTSTKAHMSHSQANMSEPSRPVSWFSELLDSIPVLPALASEFPQIVRNHKTRFESKDLLTTNSGQSSTSIQTSSAWSARFKAVSVSCSCEFMSGLWRLSTLQGFKPQTFMSKDETAWSANTPVHDIAVCRKHSDKDGCFGRRGNGHFSLMFFLGALSALWWFLLLHMLWRLTSHMGFVLI